MSPSTANIVLPSITCRQQGPIPYAYQYILETFFNGSAYDLDIPCQWDFSSKQLDTGFYLWENCLDLYATGLTGTVGVYTTPLDFECPLFYWEVGITYENLGNQSSMFGGLGFEDNIFEGAYHDTGAIVIKSTLQGLPARLGYTLGCGYQRPYSMFFTKNGTLLGYRYCQKINRSPRAHLELGLRHSVATSIHTNFGQQPFMFDIVTYCREQYAPLQRLTSTLPMEIVETIFCSLLLLIEEDMGSEDISRMRRGRRTLGQITSVSRRCRYLCREHTFRMLLLTSRADIRYTIDRPSLWKAHHVVTRELAEGPWLRLENPNLQFLAKSILIYSQSFRSN